MRGIAATTLLRSLRSDESGASLVLVALSLVWIVAMISLVVDIGGGWLSRQSLIPATDAAALAAAQDLVAQPSDENGACSTAASYVATNDADATMIGCDVTSFGTSGFLTGGFVTVTASDDVDSNFASPGTPDLSVQSVSSAAWGPPTSVIGLRPLSFCYDGSAALQQLIDNPPAVATSVVISYPKDDPADCGGSTSAGNFATLDFEGGATIQEIRNWTSTGYPGQVSFDPPSVVDCTGGAICYDRPYASIEIIAELQSLIYAQSFVAFPVFNYTDTTDVHLIGMVRARLDGFDFSGPPSNQWIEVTVEPGLIVGTCCGPPGAHAGNQVIAICGVDPGAVAACVPTSGP